MTPSALRLWLESLLVQIPSDLSVVYVIHLCIYHIFLCDSPFANNLSIEYVSERTWYVEFARNPVYKRVVNPRATKSFCFDWDSENLVDVLSSRNSAQQKRFLHFIHYVLNGCVNIGQHPGLVATTMVYYRGPHGTIGTIGYQGGFMYHWFFSLGGPPEAAASTFGCPWQRRNASQRFAAFRGTPWTRVVKVLGFAWSFLDGVVMVMMGKFSRLSFDGYVWWLFLMVLDGYDS